MTNTDKTSGTQCCYDTINDVDRYCINCGEEDHFLYERTTSTGDHYKCFHCGEDLCFVEQCT